MEQYYGIKRILYSSAIEIAGRKDERNDYNMFNRIGKEALDKLLVFCFQQMFDVLAVNGEMFVELRFTDVQTKMYLESLVSSGIANVRYGEKEQSARITKIHDRIMV